VPPCIAEKPQLLSLLRALMEVDQEKRLTVRARGYLRG
jgi:hypothetical protein